MKLKDVKKFIEDNKLLTIDVKNKPGIYAITIDGFVVYVGQSKDVRRRCEQHIYNIENAMLIQEQKYLLLLSAKLGGHTVDCIGLEYVPEESLLEQEQNYISQFLPILNINVGGGRQNIYDLKIEDVLNHIIQKRKETYDLFFKEEK